MALMSAQRSPCSECSLTTSIATLRKCSVRSLSSWHAAELSAHCSPDPSFSAPNAPTSGTKTYPHTWIRVRGSRAPGLNCRSWTARSASARKIAAACDKTECMFPSNARETRTTPRELLSASRRYAQTASK
eukprot:3444573-Prymnesium_polylepis.2